MSIEFTTTPDSADIDFLTQKIRMALLLFWMLLRI